MMSRTSYGRLAGLLLMVGLSGCQRDATPSDPPATDGRLQGRPYSFRGSKAGDEREVVGITLCWCPPGRFTMGSPPGEPERRPGEDQVEVTLAKGFWMGKYEATQGQWKRVIGKLPGELTVELLEGDDFPVSLSIAVRTGKELICHCNRRKDKKLRPRSGRPMSELHCEACSAIWSFSQHTIS